MSATFTAKPLPLPRVRRFLALVIAVAAISLWPPPGASGRAVPSLGDGGGSLAGRLLVAAESMGDPRFRNSVIYMVEHNAGGAMGLIVNLPFGAMSLARLFEHLGLKGGPKGDLEAPEVAGEIEVYYGGPVAPERGFLLHSAEVIVEGSIVVGEGVAMTADAEMLHKIARGEGPKRSLFALGYSGWGPGQLETELARDDWFTIPFDPDLVFAVDPARSWQRAAARRSLDL
ncbi:MAG: YqgE/AlgH family protein [Alphaproteobacteria bacterium]